MPEELFDVIRFYSDDSYETVTTQVRAKEAALIASRECMKPAASIGQIKRVIIVDSGDMTCFEWQFDKGIVFPPPESH